ncbi:MAG: hypothetical protein ABI634_07960 [Acidobacteriota bacterium]
MTLQALTRGATLARVTVRVPEARPSRARSRRHEPHVVPPVSCFEGRRLPDRGDCAGRRLRQAAERLADLLHVRGDERVELMSGA